MKIAILTSSRADYGIYKPLLKALYADDFFQVSIIAFGTHLSSYHGETVNNIINDGYKVDYKISSLLLTDDDASVSASMGLTTIKFAEFWKEHANEFDWVLCLGDRFEMFAAVMAGLSIGVKFAHIHGGETTLGAIDNVFRHSITLASRLHFVASTAFADRVRSLLDTQAGDIVVSGALSLDNLSDIALLDTTAFKEKWNIDLNIPSILITIHPETADAAKNGAHIKEIETLLPELQERYQLIITMPNADTNGSLFRAAFQALGNKYPDRIKLIENFGTQSYFSCMQHAKLLLGNTSSGIIEAASFDKYVINLGDRQKGRLAGNNVLHVPFEKAAILSALAKIEASGDVKVDNVYYSGGAVKKIVNKLKDIG
jgi:GDP/UDP-N,N'-diacetylbacillosamine 2-epimerase (hydrolysing)